MINLIKGDCLEEMKQLESNSVDSITTDPPYGINFMNKKWDYDIPQVEHFKEMLRVLKPGGHILCACGTRTQHRMAVNIEDAGFEIRDVISWIYGSGFPKSLNVGKSVNKLETKEWSNIGNAIDNIDQKSIIKIWKTNLNNANNVETQLQKNQTETGICMPRSVFVQENAVQKINQERSNASVGIVEISFIGHQATNIKINTVLKNVEAEIKQSLNLAKSVEQLSQDQNLYSKEKMLSMNIFTAQCDVKEWLKENTTVNLKVDEVLKTLRGNQKYSNEEITNVLCVVLTDILKLTILNQSKIFQNLDTNSQTECVSAINVTITEYIMEHLITNMVDILKRKSVDKLLGNERESETVKGKVFTGSNNNINGESGEYKITKGTSPHEGWGTALKPAQEFFTLARKPLSEKTIAKNVLKWGTGGINIEKSRVGTKDTRSKTSGAIEGSGWGTKGGAIAGSELGRFPANLIHDGSDEVVSGFPDSKGWSSQNFNKINIYGGNSLIKSKSILEGKREGFNDSGSASRFFYCAKSSKRERNRGLDGYLTVKYNECISNNKNLCKEENMVAVMLLKKVISESILSFSTGECGESIMVQCHKDFLSTILTEINKIIESKILNSLMHSLTNEFTLDVSLEKENGGNLVENVENLKKFLLTITKENQELALGASRVALKMLLLTKEEGSWKQATNFHSTVKPIKLMKYLCRLITPKNGTCLDPYMGSGSTGIACKEEGFGFIGIEKDKEYLEIAKARIDNI